MKNIVGHSLTFITKNSYALISSGVQSNSFFECLSYGVIIACKGAMIIERFLI